MRKKIALGITLAVGLALLFGGIAFAQSLKTKAHTERGVLPEGVEFVRGEVLVKFKQGVPDREIASFQSATGTEVISEHRGGVRKLRIPRGRSEEDFVARLQQDSRVEFAELNTKCYADFVPNDPYYNPYQWHFPNVNCPTAWDISTGSGVLVAILDSGVAYENYNIPSYELGTVQSGVTQYQQAPDLAGTSFAAGYDFINDDNHPNDNNGHGTHVAGTIAQTTNNSYGVAGMAFNATIMPAKVLDYSGSGTASSLADALYWIADHGAQVANMSLSWPAGYNPGSTVQNAIQYAYNAGVVLVGSSGNQGVSTVSYPAAYSQVIAVGATRYDDQLTSYSQYGSAQELTAPGGDIFVDQNGDGYGDGVLQNTFDAYDPGPPEVKANPTSFGWWFYEGTSMAAPHVTALAAMVIANGQTGVENVRTIMHESAVDLGSPGWDSSYGYGRIDAYAALTYGGTPPVAAFSGAPTSGCATLTVNFTDESTGEIDTWDWTFGDGGTSTQQNPSHQYTNPGDYTVTLTVTGPNGSDGETKTNYIHVDGPPAAGFVGSPTTGTAPLTVNFTDQSTGQVTSWDWDFGDGSAHSGAQNPSHQYTTDGTYTVTLVASGPCGSDTEIKTDYITVNPCVAPTADFVGSPTSGTAPLTVSFTDLSSGSPTSWDWTFGDGGTSTQQNPTYEYTAAGDYTVTLTATNPCGSDLATKTNYIHVDPATGATAYALSDIPVAGTVSGDYTDTHASDDSYEVLTERQSGGKPSSRYSYLEHRWNFNVTAGTSVIFNVEAYRPDNSEGDDFAFQYSTDGTNFTTLVTVASATEQVYSAAMPSSTSGLVYIRVVDTDQTAGRRELDAVYVDHMYIESTSGPVPPVANFEGSPTAGAVPLTVSFTDLSSGNPTSWDWTFGDGGTSTAQHPAYEYTAAGVYTVSLTVVNAYGSDTETKVDYITVTEGGCTMHVHDMTVSRKAAGPNCSGLCTVVIYDEVSAPVAGATVYVTATGPVGGSYSGTTLADGSVSFETGKTKSCSGEWCFEVTDVTHASCTYDAAANNVTLACESGWISGGGTLSMGAIGTRVEFGLQQNNPNPFIPSTSLSFSLAEAGRALLEIYDVTGRRVATLVDGEMGAGAHELRWDATGMAGGVYFAKLTAGAESATIRMILLR